LAVVFIPKPKISRSELGHLRDFVTQVNADILARYDEKEPVLNEGNLSFCLWSALRDAKKDKDDFHRMWASGTLLQIAKIHPFGEGNKRTSYVIAKLILRLGRYDFTVNYDDAVHYLKKIAAGKVPFNEVYSWIHRHAQPTKEEPPEEIMKFISLLEKIV
jgi:death-on-curing family protein